MMKAPNRKPVTRHEAVSAKVDDFRTCLVDGWNGTEGTWSGMKISSNSKCRGSSTGRGDFASVGIGGSTNNDDSGETLFDGRAGGVDKSGVDKSGEILSSSLAEGNVINNSSSSARDDCTGEGGD